MNRLDYSGWYYCPAHDQMERWYLGTCIAQVPIKVWDDFAWLVKSPIIKLAEDYPVVEHGPDPISLR